MSPTTADLVLRAEIEELVTRYATAIDHRDWDLFRSVFADDARIDYGPLMGTWDDADVFTDFMRQVHAPAGRSIHRMTNITVKPGDVLAAVTYGDSIILEAANEANYDHGAASYDDTFVRTETGLKISSRTTRVVLFEKLTTNIAIGL
ncbi:nuclear transport factor 2 family protein [Herbidospora mongoliensis]|uniref:nuclear transport factor 2 family protein n=1 Tax=Herbidospora mongoliensis TaxID=688067 RepID=UPI000833EA93|nr:nuclear transport factor 2 family protein [Herbidospora mongoliensis]